MPDKRLCGYSFPTFHIVYLRNKKRTKGKSNGWRLQYDSGVTIGQDKQDDPFFVQFPILFENKTIVLISSEYYHHI